MTPAHPTRYPVHLSYPTDAPPMHSTELALLTATLLASPLLAAAPRDAWYRSLGEARRVARKSKLPLFVVFRCET